MSCRNAKGYIIGVGLGLVLLLGVGSTALAKGSPESKARAARQACLAGDYRKGVALLSELFMEGKDPTWIFNQGRCLEQNARYEEAIARFNEYLRLAPNASETDRESARKHSADCLSLLGRSGDNATTPPAQEPTAKSEPLPPPPVVPVVPVAPPPPPPSKPAKSSDGSGLRTAGIVVGASGLVLVGAGVVLNLKANSLASDLKQEGGYSRGKASDRDSYRALSLVGYGVGGACLVGGLILYLAGHSAGSSSSVALLPMGTRDSAGFLLQGAF